MSAIWMQVVVKYADDWLFSVVDVLLRSLSFGEMTNNGASNDIERNSHCSRYGHAVRACLTNSWHGWPQPAAKPLSWWWLFLTCSEATAEEIDAEVRRIVEGITSTPDT